jgi:hypothetical protein
MRLLVFSLLTALTTLTAPAVAEPQAKVALPLYYLGINAEGFAEAVFAEPYGRRLVAEFAAVLGESGTAECLKSRGIEKDQLAERARAILLRQGAQLLGKFAATIDMTAFTEKLAASEGADAAAELTKLRENRDVHTFDEISRPALLAEAADIIVENLDRYALLLRIRLARPVSPFGSGDKALLDANPTEKSVEALGEFMTKTRSAAVDRYLDLSQSVQLALNESISRDAMLNLGPAQLLSGLDKDLAELCVSGPR